MKNVYEFEDYKEFLKDWAQRQGRGARLKMAKAMNCQLAYVSIVLGSDRHLSVDQAEALSRHLRFNRDETECLIWLVEKARAGTPSSAAFFARLLEKKREEVRQIKKRLNIRTGLKESAKAIYYSDMLYSAIHIALTIPALQNRKALAAHFELGLDRINEVLKFLLEQELAQEEKGQLRPTQKQIYLDRDSPFSAIHHNNWRMAALRSLSRRKTEDIHLSMVVSLSEKDVNLVREKLAACIADISQTIKKSPEESLMACNLDFFQL